MEDEEQHIKTDFMDRQAREMSTPMLQQGPVRIVIAIVVIGILFGGYNLVMFVMNMGKNAAIGNVAVNLKEPDLQDGVARVDVNVANLNATWVDKIQFKYIISGPDGTVAASGVVGVPDKVPAGATRTFRHVKLGPLQGEAARMKAELVDLNMGPKPSLSAGLDARFSEIMLLKGAEAVGAFNQFVGQAPKFAPGFVGLGRAYMAEGDDAKAKEAFKKAVEIDPKDADAHYELGLALLNQKDRTDAEKEIGAAYELAPNDPDIQKTISENRK
ncbi:hypothetical protein BH10CYA1_BH10CYA1_00120 [soil metagenome]